MPERAREIAELLAAAGGGAGITGFFTWLTGRKPGEAAILAAAAQLQTALNKAAESTVADLRAQVEELADEVSRLKGELRQEQQRSQSLETMLRKNGYDLAAATEPGALMVAEGETVTVIPPARTKKRPK
jgi:uncharacterized protein HemX